ncbi:helix-turn-helix transcriptional regulator [Candidatus Avelusimicrobium luingense]|uniref:helix-turn-helix transcriptional regulator n=1 Tax=Candidatus Avelusimicrobium luingense TaxID=3416211 RepID=UPI003D1451E4
MQKEMQNKLTRLLYELNSLDKGPINLAKMAAEVGVNVRTIQRDMNEIQSADFPLWNPKPGDYAFIAGCSLQRMKLSGAEASLLVVMNEMASSLGGNFGRTFSILKNRLLAMPQDNPFFIKLNNGEIYIDTPITKTLEECIRERKWVNVCYRGGKLACYEVRPLKLMWMEGFWYLLSLTNTDKLLKFRLEKISSAKATNKPFKYDKNIDDILRNSTNIWFEQDRPLHVKMEVSAECAHFFKQKNYFPLQKLEKELKDGRIVLSCKAAKEEEILPTILHWLPHIKVLSPTSLRKRVKDVLNNYLRSVK